MVHDSLTRPGEVIKIIPFPGTELLSGIPENRRSVQGAVPVHQPQLGGHIKKAGHAVAIDEIRMEFDATLMEEAPGRDGSQVTEVW